MYIHTHTYMNIYIWRCHKEDPCIAILNKQKFHFFFFYKILKQEDGTGVVCGGVLLPVGGVDVGKGCRSVNIE
jgi:hypothetical protein